MQEANPKQQIVEKIKNSTNILVTVGSNPSVDELSAALAFALMLNRMEKHSTAVFSGSVPPAISFLEPEKTFEDTVDSLRDFIIALDKEKADRLRYKVEDDVVRIFITPYKTVLSEKDLQFSQGDFNVELIVALGVEKREDLDAAITAHGRILHDATVVTINMNGAKSSLGTLDWTDTEASSLCEMLMSLSEALQPGLLDQQIATALLTGIVSATDRFRNDHTTPKVMTMSAQLMAAGANQQLIADKLEEGNGLETDDTSVEDDHQDVPEGDTSKKLHDKETQKQDKNEDGSLTIEHEAKDESKPLPEPGAEALQAAEEELAENLEQHAQQQATSTDNLAADIQQQHEEELATPVSAQEDDAPRIKKGHRTRHTDDSQMMPRFGGTLNATAGDEEERKRREDAAKQNRDTLSHDNGPVAPAPALPPLPPLPGSQQPVDVVPPTPALGQSHNDPMLQYEPTEATPPTPAMEQSPVPPLPPVESPDATATATLADLDAQTRGQAEDDARAAVDAALGTMPFNPAGQPLQSSGALPGLEVAHDASAAPAMPPLDPVATAYDTPPAPISAPAGVYENAPQQMAPGLPTPPPLPPLPDFAALPPLPGESQQQMASPAAPQSMAAPAPIEQPLAPQAAQPTDPGQFRIPGQ